MLNKLVDLFLKERLIVYFTVILIIAAGIFSFLQLPIEAYPDLTNTRVQIISQWGGKSAEEMEKFVTIPIETEMNSVPNLLSQRSISLFGLSVITLIFDDKTDDFFARSKINEHLQNVNLPDGVKPNLSAESAPTGEIYRYILEGDGVSTMDLKTIEDWVLERQYKSVSGVADVVSFGGPTKQYEVDIDPHKLQYYGLTIRNVLDALGQNNSNAGGSILEHGDQAFVFRGVGLLKNIDDIKRVIVSSFNGVPLTIGQLGEVKIGNAIRLGKVGNNQKDDVVEAIILMRRGENASEVIKRVEEKTRELNDNILPKNVRIVPYYDRADLVGLTTHTVYHNLIEGMVLVIVVLFIFLGNTRSAIIAAIIVPLSLLFAFILMQIKGMSANLLSLGAIDFGVIIDGAVIMIEAIFTKLVLSGDINSEKRIEIVKGISVEMSKPIFFSIIIIICSMIPIFSFQQIEGRMFSPLAYTLGFALIGALVLSLTFVPAISVDFLKGKLKERAFLINKLHKIYDRVLNFSLNADKPILAIGIILVAISIYSSRFLGTEFLPHLNEGDLWVRATMPLSVGLTTADSITTKIRNIFLKYDEVKNVVSQLGRPDDGTDATGYFNSEFFVDLKPENEWKNFNSKGDLINDMNEKLNRIPGVDFNFSQYIEDNIEEAVTGVKGELAVKIFGDDLSILETKAQEIKNVISNVNGITDVGVFSEIGQPVLQVSINRMKIAQFGVNVNDVQDLIESSIGGRVATQFYEGEKHFDLVVRIEENYRNSIEKISTLLVSSNSGLKVPLSQIADISYQPGAAFIFREKNSRFIAVKFSVRDRDLGGAVQEARKVVAKNVKLPSGYYTVWGGEFESQQRAMGRLAIVVPISLLLICMLLYLAFDSWGYTLLILSSLPFSLVGGIFGLLTAHLHFSVSAGIGFIALFGVSVQDGVVLLSYMKHHRNEYTDKIALIKDACQHRLRPIIMVALLAILGLLPAALSTGIGSETQKPLAVVIVSGLLVATILKLIMLPIMYKLFTPNK